MIGNRAIKYRRLALTATDPDVAKLLRQLADEADRGVLATADWCLSLPKAQSEANPIGSEGVAAKTFVPISGT